MIVVSFFETTRRAFPSIAISAFSNVIPTSSEITVAPIVTATSSRVAFLLSPKPGAFTASTLNVPLSLLTIKVESASPSTSSAIMTRSFFPAAASFSSKGKTSFIDEIFLSVTRIAGSVYSASILSLFVTRYGEIYPLSNSIPSVTSDSRPID